MKTNGSARDDVLSATRHVIELSEASLQRAARERVGRELAPPRQGASNFHVARPERLALDRMVQRSFRDPQATFSMIGPITGAIAELLAHAQTGMLSALAQRWRNREILLSRAEHFLRIKAECPFDAQALAAAVGATERSLQLHFLDAYGMTPGQWARCRALHQVRDRLLRTDARRFTVEAIAHECGFRHMGRFSSYYRELFDEFPSETLARVGESATRTSSVAQPLLASHGTVA